MNCGKLKPARAKRFFVSCRYLFELCTHHLGFFDFDLCPEIWRGLVKFLAKFKFGAKTENSILTLEKHSDSNNIKNKFRTGLKLARNG